MRLVKIIHPDFVMSYPAMTVYEFEHFKEEKEVLECWKKASVYIICQRPVLYFDEIIFDEDNSDISLKIKQRDDPKEILVTFNIAGNEECLGKSDGFWIEVQFFDNKGEKKQPYMNAAGIKIFNNDKDFLLWLTPERLLYMYWTGQFEAEFEGDVHDFIKYNVHYIGQAKNQNIWDRLTGHEKLSKVLALEHPFIEGEFSPYELSLIFLQFKGFREDTMLVPDESSSDDIVDLHGKRMKEMDIVNSFIPSTFDEIMPFAVNDFEAYLINLLEPKYNKILFKNYPDLKRGLTSIGFCGANYEILLFATLITDVATMSVTIRPIYEKNPN